jgi:hypothetical protein
MKRNIVTLRYIIYFLIIISLTFYFSVGIIEHRYVNVADNVNRFFTGWFIRKSEYMLQDIKYPFNESTSCPCKNIGKSMPACPFTFNKKSENPILIYELKPNYEGIYDGADICLPPTKIKINSDGFRDYKYSVEKPNNTFRIIALGDSHTVGLGVELNETYSKVLEKLLNVGRQRYEVLNLGVDGYDLIQKIEILKRKGLTYNPDLILLQYCGDDIVNRSFQIEIEEKALNEFAKKNNISTYEIDEFTKRKILVNISTMLIDENEKNSYKLSVLISNYLDDLKKTIENKNIKVLILTFQSRPVHAEILKKISKNYGWYFLDLNSIYEEFDISKLSVGYPYDGHPNPSGMS